MRTLIGIILCLLSYSAFSNSSYQLVDQCSPTLCQGASTDSCESYREKDDDNMQSNNKQCCKISKTYGSSTCVSN